MAEFREKEGVIYEKS